MIKYLTALFFIFALPASVLAADDLVKSNSSDAVYYIDNNNIRHAFPNRATYESWYGGDFSAVQEIDEIGLAEIPLGENVTMRPGKYLLKVPSSPEVYALEPGGVLRHLTSVKVAKEIYGSSWEFRLRDLPEVFLENYEIGEPINFNHQIPDGVVYQYSADDKYFWKNNGIVEPFDSWSDVFANGYDKGDVVRGDINYHQKIKPILGRSDRIFNLSLPANYSTASCQAANLRAAVLFVTRDPQISQKEIDVIQATIDGLPLSWSAATDNLSRLSMQADAFTIYDPENTLLKENSNGVMVFNFEELTLQFYETNNDEYDFLIVYNDFLQPEQYLEKASYHLVRNDNRGTARILLDRSRFHGSHGRLKGIVNMNKIDQYSVSSSGGLVSLLNLMHHEILHHWAASVSYINSHGERAWNLLEEDQLHWSRWMNFVSPLGGWGWQQEAALADGNSLYSSQRRNLSGDEIIQFSALDLYLMGLVSERYISPISFLIPDDLSSVSDEVLGQLQYISIDDVIAAHGNLSCKK